MILGIDLGTTNSVAAYMTEDGPRLVRNAFGETLTPSIVGVDLDGATVIGRVARELQVKHPDRCASLFKRHMGSEFEAKLAGKPFTPETLSSLVLRSLKQDAEAETGQPLTDAVITVPAYFNEPQRQATLAAGRIAGLNVRRILNEPTAAAMAYGLRGEQNDKVVAVIDLGGGTFDVSIVEQFEGALEVRASAGECFLGGEDFTRALASRALETQGLLFERVELEKPLLLARLIQQCEMAKRELTRQGQATIRIPNARGDLDENSPVVTLTRELFETATQAILARIELPIRRALGDARLNRGDLSEVLLVGGATRMPQVVARVAQLFGQTPKCRFNPDEVVALGAAVQAGLIENAKAVSDLVVTDVCPFTLGIEISKKFDLEYHDGYFMPIIHRNTTIPVSRVERVNTIAPNQVRIALKVYQGERRRTKENVLLGEFEANMPPGPPGQELDVRFTYDLNGVLEVEATVVETGVAARHVITRHARRMTEAQLTQALEAMASLKTHPREESVNRLTLRRAERIYQELPPIERQRLGLLLDGFETALAQGDKALIDLHRENLIAMLDEFERTGDEELP